MDKYTKTLYFEREKFKNLQRFAAGPSANRDLFLLNINCHFQLFDIVLNEFTVAVRFKDAGR
ncbi:hypothetical protein PbDSM24746_00640 [Paenibacillus macerans]|nr:hypothetical protein PbDSM24746_00640 [Paenibacillus macerans]GBK66356.1 hypothetical protein PbJCM17693_00640 [Paenibacillus macerans]GIP09661.1 hypothetical protein J1TS5_18310 [Paenibacillus macerans]